MSGEIGGRTREQEACVVLTLRDGRIVSDHTYIDTAGMMKKFADALPAAELAIATPDNDAS